MRVFACAALAVVLLGGVACVSGSQASATWPASASGRPAFYYFGTPG